MKISWRERKDPLASKVTDETEVRQTILESGVFWITWEVPSTLWKHCIKVITSYNFPCHAGSIDWNFCQYNEILFSAKALYFNFSQGAIFVSFQTREGQLLCCKCLVRFYLKNIALNLSFKTVWNELKSMTVVLV